MSIEIPDAMGDLILSTMTEAHPEKADKIGFLLIAVSHGEPLATMTNLPDEEQLYLLGIAYAAISEQQMTVSSLLNTEGSA